MGAGKGRQFKRRTRKGEIIAAPQAAALECLGPVRNWLPKRLCAPISSWEPSEPGEQTLWQSQSELKGRLGPRLAGPSYSLTITPVLFRTGARESGGTGLEGGHRFYLERKKVSEYGFLNEVGGPVF